MVLVVIKRWVFDFVVQEFKTTIMTVGGKMDFT